MCRYTSKLLVVVEVVVVIPFLNTIIIVTIITIIAAESIVYMCIYKILCVGTNRWVVLYSDVFIYKYKDNRLNDIGRHFL